MAESELKVDVKAFTAASEEISAMTKNLEQSVNAYLSGVNSLRSVWQGDGSNNVKAMAQSMLNSMELLMTHLSAYPKALGEVAGIYVTSEKQLAETGKSLNFDSSSMM